jgi:hypothetical protein
LRDAAGAAIAVLGRSADRASEFVSALEATGGNATLILVDDADEGSLESARQHAEERLGGFHILFNEVLQERLAAVPTSSLGAGSRRTTEDRRVVSPSASAERPQPNILLRRQTFRERALGQAAENGPPSAFGRHRAARLNVATRRRYERRGRPPQTPEPMASHPDDTHPYRDGDDRTGTARPGSFARLLL